MAIKCGIICEKELPYYIDNESKESSICSIGQHTESESEWVI